MIRGLQHILRVVGMLAIRATIRPKCSDHRHSFEGT